MISPQQHRLNHAHPHVSAPKHALLRHQHTLKINLQLLRKRTSVILIMFHQTRSRTHHQTLALILAFNVKKKSQLMLRKSLMHCISILNAKAASTLCFSFCGEQMLRNSKGEIGTALQISLSCRNLPSLYQLGKSVDHRKNFSLEQAFHRCNSTQWCSYHQNLDCIPAHGYCLHQCKDLLPAWEGNAASSCTKGLAIKSTLAVRFPSSRSARSNYRGDQQSMAHTPSGRWMHQQSLMYN